MASHLLHIDLVSFKCPLVAMALPGKGGLGSGVHPMAQLEQMKHFAWICKVSLESTCIENTQCSMKDPSSLTSGGAVYKVVSESTAFCFVEQSSQAGRELACQWWWTLSRPPLCLHKMQCCFKEHCVERKFSLLNLCLNGEVALQVPEKMMRWCLPLRQHGQKLLSKGS